MIAFKGELTEVTHTTMDGDVKIWIIYLLSFLLVINYPDTAQCKFLVSRSCQIRPPHKNGHNSFNFHPRSPKIHMEVDLYSSS